MSREIARTVTSNVWQTILAVAPSVHKSHMFPGITSPEAAAVIMLKGYELGLGLTASFEFINIVKGKPRLSPKGALALVHRSGLLADIKISEQPGSCTVWMKRTNGVEYQLTWTLQDAERAGLVTKAGTTGARGQVREEGNWEKYEANMLRWRATGFVEDYLFPDVLGGMYRADEFGASVDADGDVIDVDPPVASTETPTPTYVAPTLPEPKVITLDELLEQYGAEAIVAANEGKVPADDAEVALVARKLAGDA